MGEIKGFVKYKRQTTRKESVTKRLTHWNEFIKPFGITEAKKQAARCMDCGTPFCQYGCPINNIIPDWNDLVYQENIKEAYHRLSLTNNFPEFTSRICPAPCENSCVLEITDKAVSIKNIERKIIDEAFKNNWVEPKEINLRTGKKIAVVGSGPAGLVCADELNKAGHEVNVFEKNELPGGLLMFGIPEFKLEKKVVLRRINILEQEGIIFKTNTEIGKDIFLSELLKEFDAVVLSGGAENPRDLIVEGRELEGIHFAMNYLVQQNRRLLNLEIKEKPINAKNKNVVVVGGGDTGSDCIGTANRQGAKSVINIELLPKPPQKRLENNPWPQWAFVDRISTSQEEGCEKHFGVLTKKITGRNGKVKKLHLVKVEFNKIDGQKIMQEIKNSDFKLEADLVLIAMGFLGPKKNKLLTELKVELDEKGNVKTDKNKMTNIRKLFATGDIRRGQSLVVWAMADGRKVAEKVSEFLIKV